MDLDLASGGDFGNVQKTTYRIVDFLEWQRNGTLDLRPDYQRRAVWPKDAKSRLIDSIIRGFPLPLIFIQSALDIETSRPVRRVIDGQQRLRTILAYVAPDSLPDFSDDDDFILLPRHHETFGSTRFPDLPDSTRAKVLETSLSVNVLPAATSPAMVLEMFRRLNSTGLKLKAQEIRNAKWFGEFKDLSYELAYEQTERWAAWGVFSSQQLLQMREVEFTSDVLGIPLRGVQAGSAAQIESLYKKYDKELEARGTVSSAFRAASDAVDGALGSGTPSRDLRKFRTAPWLYALFALAIGVNEKGDYLPESAWSGNRLLRALQRADGLLRSPDPSIDENLDKALRGATSDRNSRLARIRFLADQA